MTSEITSPSRRQIAKGAAWAVPAVSLAAAAPSLAASPNACEPGTSTLVVSVERCDGLALFSSVPRFRITNPETAECTVPADTPVTLSGSGVASINLLGPDLANVGVLHSSSGAVALANDLAPGQSVVVNAFPPGINVSVLGTVNLNIDTASAGFDLTNVAGLISLCEPA